ncbi:hypothetical protein C121_49 [Stenotrophomonas phage C121]|uniref:hypothetical protein n=1 Tax=Stenotrophomonas phage C121 TaxID=2914029 RepID=UPI00232950EF|nr:hypothetical protein PP752_gp49 [Stenotrophomonas phage C121]UKL14782.1 hypothetical protein C121_49 [Stenotrophomonas phage C121]
MSYIKIPTERNFPKQFTCTGVTATGTKVVLVARDAGLGYVWLPEYGNRPTRFDSWKTAMTAGKATDSIHYTYRPDRMMFEIQTVMSPEEELYRDLFDRIKKYAIKD